MVSDDWKRVQLKEVCKLIYRYPSFYGMEKSSQGVPVVRGEHLLNTGRISTDWKDYWFVTEEYANQFPKTRLSLDDVVMSVRGTVGQFARVGNEHVGAQLSPNAIRISPDCEKIYPPFLYYALRSNTAYSFISGCMSSSAVPALRAQDIGIAPIDLPPLPEQRAIAHILGTLDDKIELNHRMNQTLEAMAQALFKSWFVDFEPFRDQGMQDSALGAIPVGWRVGKLSELCTTQYGYTASAIEEPVGPHLLRVMDINKQNWIEWHKVPYCEIGEPDKSKYHLEVGDIVVARMADPGKCAIIEQSVDAVFASYLVRLKTGSLACAYFIYGFLKSKAYADYAEGAIGGSSVQKSMNAKVIVDVDLVIPPRNILDRYLEYVLPLRKCLTVNIRETATLASVRDALLPKLLSGKIRVKDAKNFVESKL